MTGFEPLELVPYETADQTGVIAVIEGCYAGYDQRIELDTLDSDLQRIDEVFAGARSAFWVLKDAGKVIGSVAVKAGEPGDCELKRVFLDATYRRRGLGQRMVKFAAHWAAEQGYQVMHIWSDVLYIPAHTLYCKLGAEHDGLRRPLGGVNNVDEFYFRLPLEGWRQQTTGG